MSTVESSVLWSALFFSCIRFLCFSSSTLRFLFSFFKASKFLVIFLLAPSVSRFGFTCFRCQRTLSGHSFSMLGNIWGVVPFWGCGSLIRRTWNQDRTPRMSRCRSSWPIALRSLFKILLVLTPTWDKRDMPFLFDLWEATRISNRCALKRLFRWWKCIRVVSFWERGIYWTCPDFSIRTLWEMIWKSDESLEKVPSVRWFNTGG